ncbi:hypothetical protein VTJ49DRAFT_7433 [Mycothermus thermophilus]|uniref:SET domain-containing protein n=1 Tax=Humicola insolens TaxID=85995 RepID=A0ABR3VHC2_HUMIN
METTMPQNEPLHTQPVLCKYALESLTSSVPLEIRASGICNGSGLFLAKTSGLDEGCEIYRAPLSLAVVEPHVTDVCHGCFREEEELFEEAKKKNPNATPTKLRICGGCKVASYCSKLKTALEHLESHPVKIDDRFVNAFMPLAPQVLSAAFAAVYSRGVAQMAKLHVNCMPLRPISRPDTVGYALDVATAMVNHSCDPNAFAFLEGSCLRVRSLRKINPGEAITFCYVTAHMDVLARRGMLKEEYYITCDCSRCVQEFAELGAVVGSDNLKNSTTLDVMVEAHSLLRHANNSAMIFGTNPKVQDLGQVESRMHAILAKAMAPGTSWPENLDPFPSFRLLLGRLYIEQGKPVTGLRNVLRGMFHRRQPLNKVDWVHTVLDVWGFLRAVGSMPRNAATKEDRTVPSAVDIRTMAYRYLDAGWYSATKVFGEDSFHLEVFEESLGVMLKQWNNKRSQLGLKEFEVKFEAAQRRVLDWAGLTEEKGIPSKVKMLKPKGQHSSG